MMFQKATKDKIRLRLAVEGPSGSGKTYTALRIASLIGGKIAVIDTENRSASKYVGESPDGIPWEFDVLNLEAPYSPDRYVEAIRAASAAGYTTIVIDSMAHMWSGKGGMLDLVDANGSNGNSFDGWRKCKPMERRFWEAILQCKIHLIATFRSKVEWVIEDNSKGKKVPRKIGMKADQRDNVEYEFDVAMMMDDDHTGTLIKTRCSAIDGEVFRKPGREFIDPLLAWINDGAERQPDSEPAAVAQPARQPEPARRPDPKPEPAATPAKTERPPPQDPMTALLAVGWDASDVEAFGVSPADTAELRRLFARARSGWRPDNKDAREADPMGLKLVYRRAKRIREATRLDVKGGIIDRFGPAHKWDHKAVDAVQEDLDALKVSIAAAGGAA